MAGWASPQICLQALVAFGELFLPQVIFIHSLLQFKQVVVLPVTFQTACNLLLAGFDARVP
jgi:hypothetical protein